MTHRILKFIGKFHKTFVLRLPQCAHVMDIQSQLDMPVLWVAVDTSISPDQYSNRTFTSFATGQEIVGIHDFQYITTLQDNHGQVWHFFEHLK